MLVEIQLPAHADEVTGFAWTAPSSHFRAFSFQLFIDREEVLDLAKVVRKNLVHGVNLIEARVAIGYREDFLVGLILVHHVQEPDRAHGDEDAGIAGLVDERDDVEGVAVFGQGARDESIVAGVVHGGVERSIEAENAELAVVLVLVARVFWDFDDHPNNLGAIRTRVEVVQFGGHVSW